MAALLYPHCRRNPSLGEFGFSVLPGIRLANTPSNEENNHER